MYFKLFLYVYVGVCVCVPGMRFNHSLVTVCPFVCCKCFLLFFFYLNCLVLVLFIPFRCALYAWVKVLQLKQIMSFTVVSEYNSNNATNNKSNNNKLREQKLNTENKIVSVFCSFVRSFVWFACQCFIQHFVVHSFNMLIFFFFTENLNIFSAKIKQKKIKLKTSFFFIRNTNKQANI